MKTPEELFAALGNRGEYAALPHVTMDEVSMIYREGYTASETAPYLGGAPVRVVISRLNHQSGQQRAVIAKLRLAINEAIAISGTGTPQDWTAAQVGLCRVLEDVKVMLREKP